MVLEEFQRVELAQVRIDKVTIPMLCIRCLFFRLCCVEVCQMIQAGMGLPPQQLFRELPKFPHEVLPMASLTVGQADHDQRDCAKGGAGDQTS